MSDHLKVDIETFRSYSPRFHGLADRLSDAELKLTGQLQGEGNCWGSDDVGQEFEHGYAPKAQTTFENSTEHSKRLDRVGDAVTLAADAFSRTENDNVNSYGSSGPR
ncbi:hypothetical protein GTV32_09835 [Gordonia sp. SID5947]|uniref:WXG100 family type VII secretion target n=1 Tax=Gordonia sp. SID5947 TaxID=2690315 RepID=UPI00137030F6|nr:hypothetical protein [Gordonia sp. SID5947]MYR06592.1 hypothetical protein [Gordonia sp. SID5947]